MLLIPPTIGHREDFVWIDATTDFVTLVKLRSATSPSGGVDPGLLTLRDNEYRGNKQLL